MALALLSGGCDGRRDSNAQGSITVELPPPRPPAAAPGFSVDPPDRAAQPGDEDAAKAVHDLAEATR
jgi:hypothetical protein